MPRFRSYRSKLQAAFVVLGLAAIGVTGWEAWAGAAEALRRATYEKLAAVRETKGRQVERYFQDVASHTLALAVDESTVSAIENFSAAWERLPAGVDTARLRSYYDSEIAPQMREAGHDVTPWFPLEVRQQALQYVFLAANPHDAGTKDLLLDAPQAGAYGAAHSRFHPTLHRYQSAFGFYDIFLIHRNGRILYTVMKEIDLGADLAAEPYRATGLGNAFRRAMEAAPETASIVDYTPYPASFFAPACFVAAPVYRAGDRIGVLAIQVSVREVNRVMTGGGNWRDEGLGATGQAYITGGDGRLRSDVRIEIEKPEDYLAHLESSGVPRPDVGRIRRYRTAILNLPVHSDLAARVRAREDGTEAGLDFFGVPVLRSHRPLAVAGVEWAVVAEIESAEALGPARDLRRRMLWIGVGIAAAFFVAATLLANSVTRPLRVLAEAARRLGSRDFAARIPVRSSDELGELAASFNRMAEDLEKTTVSRRELEVLAGRLIHAQEDERARLARELHDDLTQRLAAVAIEAGRLQRLPEADTAEWRAGLQRIREQMGRLSADVHGMSRGLHPSALDDLGLVAAVEGECRAFFERTGVPVSFQHEGELEDVPRQMQLTLYRIAQESLRNISRHAAASEVDIELRNSGGAVRMEICDNGRGFDRAQQGWRAGLGLASMEERVRLLGGRLAVESTVGRGTRILVELQSDAQTESAVGG
jgi:signal transduction histidine kinase